MDVVALCDETRLQFMRIWSPHLTELHPLAPFNKEGFLLDNFYLPQPLSVLYSIIGHSSSATPWPMLVMQSEYMFEDEKRAFRELLHFLPLAVTDIMSQTGSGKIITGWGSLPEPVWLMISFTWIRVEFM